MKYRAYSISYYFRVIPILLLAFPFSIQASDPQIPTWNAGQAVFYNVKVFNNDLLLADLHYRIAVIHQETTDELFWYEIDLLGEQVSKLMYKKLLVRSLSGQTIFTYLLGGSDNLRPHDAIVQIGNTGPQEYPPPIATSPFHPDNTLKSIVPRITSVPESVTVPAGIFQAVKYQYNASSEITTGLISAELWAIDQIPVIGVAKYISKKVSTQGNNIVKKNEYRTECYLTSLTLTGETTFIQGVPTTARPFKFKVINK